MAKVATKRKYTTRAKAISPVKSKKKLPSGLEWLDKPRKLPLSAYLHEALVEHGNMTMRNAVLCINDKHGCVPKEQSILSAIANLEKSGHLFVSNGTRYTGILCLTDKKKN